MSLFRADLKSRFENIFGFRKVTFDAPNPETNEQDTLFIEIQEARTIARKGSANCKVTGYIVVYSQYDKLPFGFFAKKIAQAAPELTRELFFFDVDLNVEKNRGMTQNLVERRTRFVFLFQEQYDPNQGTMTGLDLPEHFYIDPGTGELIDSGTGESLEIK